MECQECHQRPASLHYTQVINGHKTEIQICEVCAKEKGYMTYPEEGYSLHNLLTGLFNFDSNHVGSPNNPLKKEKELECTKCGLTLTQFKQIGKFGCGECYHAFSSSLNPIFRRVHSGNTEHRGKIPKRKGGSLHLKKQIATYKSQLQDLIINEEFEQAAVVRDKIKDLENKITEAGDSK
ncbi:UvrB/UvrC motif-containing protein [Ornithinibacillus halotolerans]|uniref:Protein-arginine kinase activator protein n=1 Tax=Ornithinibacillus halotolerans TaxID=1274357 RepID=A0A916WCI3_9BACI|nr:UvrB/UvrC motif-containing protein [Ornithinibacillus halotolerans]GGA88545.1 protein-arginine kinase activator protein [Ornithinibacillus halotolerans]